MKKYEVMAIFSNELKESEFEKQIESSLKKRIKDAGGSFTFEDYWGARGFAYIIKKQKWGYYFVAQFEIEPNKLKEIEREWNIDGKMLRFLVTSVDSTSPPPRKYEEMKAEYDALEKEAKKNAPKTEARKPYAAKKEKLTTVKEKPAKEDTSPAEVPKEPKKEKEEPKKEAPAKDAVDKKLDDIIKDSSLDL